MHNLDDATFEEALNHFGNSVGALVIADLKADRYRSLVRKGVFKEIIAENGAYKDLFQTLWFHFKNSDKAITEEYCAFIPNFGKFAGKYSKRSKLIVNSEPRVVQTTVYPLKGTELYLLALDELDESESIEKTETQEKVSTMQNVYLFSMRFDLTRDVASSLSLTEVSEETMNSQIGYTEWRDTIVNMIWENDRAEFLKRSDPDYLRSHFKPGHIESFDCQMRNLEGEYIWVKLIFSRMDAANENDYRFVYMVQNIHDSIVNLKTTIKRYEELASRDPLTKIFNRGRIETELCSAVENFKKNGESAALMIMDIDFFKNVNDTHGHAVGDAALAKFANIVSDFFKDRKAVCGRWGGEEFAVVAYGRQSCELESMAEALRARVAGESFKTVGSITCSVGATMLRGGDTLDSWFDRADKAVYSAKDAGRNRVCVK